MKTLFLCEKPNQAKDLAAVLGGERAMGGHIETNAGTVTWAVGHLLQLAEPDDYDPKWRIWSLGQLPIVPQEWRYVPEDSRKSQLNHIGRLLREAREVVIATDPAREGEMIAREILAHFRFGGAVRRLWLKSKDPAAVRKLLENMLPGEKTAPLYFAARSRAQADWLLGMNLTRGVTKRFGVPDERGVFSVGRVQTPTLALVVRRDRAIANFVPVDYFELVAAVDTSVGTRVALKHSPPEESRILVRTHADALAAQVLGFRGPISVVTEQKSTAPPRPFTLTALQRRMNALLGWSAQHTLDVAQALYDRHKLTTYPRTDCDYLDDAETHQIPTIVANLRNRLFPNLPEFAPIVRTNVWDASKTTDHTAIMPTTVDARSVNLTPEEAACYRVIAARFLELLLPDYEYLSTRMTLDAGGREFAASGTTPVKWGWKVVLGESPVKDALPEIADGTEGTIERVDVVAAKTKPPAAYTEATLLEDMESVAKFVTDPHLRAKLKETSGIGTSATRAPLLQELKRKEYIREAKSGKGAPKLLSTGRGQQLIEIIERHLPRLTDAGETAVWEEQLGRIEQGESSEAEFMRAIAAAVKRDVELLKTPLAGAVEPSAGLPTTTAVCPSSGLPVTAEGRCWAFPGFAGISFWRKICEREISAEDYVAALSAAPAPGPVLSGFKSKSGRAFDAALRFDPGSAGKEIQLHFADRATTASTAPEPAVPGVRDCGTYWQFESTPAARCFKTVAKRNMSIEDYRAVLRGGSKGAPFTGFVSQSGKTFAARLRFNPRAKPDPKFEFIFE